MKENIDLCMKHFIENQDMAGGALIVRKNQEIIYKNKWGYANRESKKEIEYDSIYRMMSMTKCIVAVAVMILIERGLIGLDDPLTKYIPRFDHMKVVSDKRYEFDAKKLWKIPFLLVTFSPQKVRTVQADREITVRDLLSHSSGLEQGLVGLFTLKKKKEQYATLEQQVEAYQGQILDFQPGTGTGYSPVAGFDVLGYLVSVVSGMTLEDFIQKEICKPLGMKDTTFFLSENQKKRLVSLYKRKRKQNKLIDVSGTKDDIAGILNQNEIRFEHGCGGLFSTIDDFDHFGEMLLNNGTFQGHQILKPDTVCLMHTEAPKLHLEPEPGFVWGLGMKIRQDPSKSNCFATQGTYGWSGAFGTHFFVSPEDEIEVVFTMNRSDIGGSGSYIIQKVEELVFRIWGDKKNE